MRITRTTAPKTCPYCGAYLDAGEQCECEERIRAIKTSEEKRNDNGIKRAGTLVL